MVVSAVPVNAGDYTLRLTVLLAIKYLTLTFLKYKQDSLSIKHLILCIKLENKQVFTQPLTWLIVSRWQLRKLVA